MTQANLAYYYVAGPVHVYIRIPVTGLGPYVTPAQLSGKIFFLGHCEDSPEPDFEPQYIPVHSSLSGPAVEDDELQMGGKYKLDLTLSRFNYTMVRLIKQFSRHGRGLAPGSEDYLSRGRLMLAQGDTFEIWLRNGFYGTANALAYPDLPIGYYYPAVRPFDVLPRKLSRETKIAHLSLKPMSVRQGVIGNTITYSQDPAYFRNLPDPG